jgi:hypothetical protein
VVYIPAGLFSREQDQRGEPASEVAQPLSSPPKPSKKAYASAQQSFAFPLSSLRPCCQAPFSQPLSSLSFFEALALARQRAILGSWASRNYSPACPPRGVMEAQLMQELGTAAVTAVALTTELR